MAEIPAAIRFVSYEPAIGSPTGFLDMIRDRFPCVEAFGTAWPIDWIIYGGESGAGRRPEGIPKDPKAWARQIRDFCRNRRVDLGGIDFWHKQSSAFRAGQGVELDGELIHELPTPRVPTVLEHGEQISLFWAGPAAGGE